MKNTFSKTLLCGVIASSFLLVNCQKAPAGRGVKPTAAGGGVATDNSNNNKMSPVATTDCNENIMKEYNTYYDLSESIRSDLTSADNQLKKASDFSDEQKSNLVKKGKDLIAQVAKLKSEIEKSKIEACFATGTKDTKRTNTNRLTVSMQVVDKNVEVAKGHISSITKVKFESPAVEDKKDMQGLKLYVADDEVADMLSKKQIETNQYIVDGQIEMGNQADLDLVVKDKDKSVCYVTAATEGTVKNQELTITLAQVETKVVPGKTKHVIHLVSPNKMYQLTCSIPAQKSLSDELKKAFGKHLTTEKTATDKEEPKVETNSVQSDAETKRLNNSKPKVEVTAKPEQAAQAAPAEKKDETKEQTKAEPVVEVKPQAAVESKEDGKPATPAEIMKAAKKEMAKSEGSEVKAETKTQDETKKVEAKQEAKNTKTAPAQPANTILTKVSNFFGQLTDAVKPSEKTKAAEAKKEVKKETKKETKKEDSSSTEEQAYGWQI